MPAVAERSYLVDFPTLFISVDWIERHCVQPDRFRRGQPFRMYNWQAFCTLTHYRVRPDAVWIPEEPLLGTAFEHSVTQVIAPQKTGKGPWSATGVALEGAGPALFAGWAGKDDGYACADHGCGCGWEYAYQPGEAMGMRWPTPLIQITATSETQTNNIYRPLMEMIKLGPLADLMRVGESFIRIGDEGRIDVVTSNALSRLGNPVTYVPHDETGTYLDSNGMKHVADTQLRGLAGMGGRSQETTNPFDPTQASHAQGTFQSAQPDVAKFYEPPPEDLDYAVKEDRAKIHAFVYAGSPHVNLDSIERMAGKLIEQGKLSQAKRFFGNTMEAGAGIWFDVEKWKARTRPRLVMPKTPISLGFDGSDSDDWTSLRAETQDGYQFTPTYGPLNMPYMRRPTIWNPAEWGGQVPRLEVGAAIRQVFTDYTVVRMYFDPPYWTTEGDQWAAELGLERVLRFATARPLQMQAAAERLLVDATKQDATWTNDGCPTTEAHIKVTHKMPRPNRRYVLCKPATGEKIDCTISSILAHEAAADITAAGLWPELVDDDEDDGKMVVG